MARFFRRACCCVVWTFVLMQSGLAWANPPFAFPWAHTSTHAVASPGPSGPAYQVLNSAVTGQQVENPIQPLNSKAGYAYGWFGSNPTPQWNRHLGFHQNMTQWKRTP